MSREIDFRKRAQEIKDRLKGRFPSVSVEVTPDGEVAVLTDAGLWSWVASYFREELGFNYLSCLSGVDYQDRFQVVAHLFLIDRDGATLGKATLKADVSRDDPRIDSITGLWPTADWYEREIYDLFGIRFSGHPDLRRILLTDEFDGYPLRKDFVDRRPARQRIVRGR